MADIEIKRGYEVLPDNNIRFGIRITNVSELAIFEVEVILDFTESLFKLEGERLQKVGVIPPASARTVEFVLKPLGCVHKVNIEALVSYRDAKSKKYRVDMPPKEVHCVCPFLKGKKMPRAEFLELSSTGHSAETGLTFRGVSVERLTSFLVQTCKSRHYKVDDFSIDGGRMLYLASESIGEKAYYLLTALIKEDDGLTQVMLRAVSDKPHGLNGFLNETVADLRHVVSTVQSAQEIGVIKKEQVINIIDSVVQRSTISMGEGAPSIKIKDSMVQRTEIKGEEERKRREEERLRGQEEQERLRREEAQKREKEEQERLRRQKEQEERTLREGKAREDAERRESERQKVRQEEESLMRQREEQERKAIEREELSAHKEPEGTSWKVFFAVALVLGVLLLGYWTISHGQTPSLAPIITSFELKLNASGISPETVNLVADVIQNRLEIIGIKNATIRKYYEKSLIIVDVPSIFALEAEANDIFREGKFEIRIQVQGNQTEHVLYSDQIVGVGVPQQESGKAWGVSFELSDAGAAALRDAAIKYGAVTNPNAHNLIMYLDDKLVFSAPFSPELAKNMQDVPLKNLIATTGTGDSGQKRAKELMIYLKTGALPVPVDVKIVSSAES